MNPINQIDFYKADHRSQYIEGTEIVFSNCTPRGSRIKEIDKLVLFGLQGFNKKYLIDGWNSDFFNKPKEEVVKKYKRRIENALGEGVITYEHIEALHDLGYLPIEIWALPEGTKVPMRVPAFVFFNTLPKFFWLTNYLESILSCVIWGPCTSATTANRYKEILNYYADLTVGNLDFVPFQGHDFSFRGMFGLEAAELSGAGHLLSFVGTDSIPAIDYLEEYYNANSDKELVGCSVAATEHSVMCMGEQNNEIKTFRNLINNTYPKGIVSIVSDTWDYWKVINEYLVELKNEIMTRDGKVVIRPDSGDPVKIICGWNIVSDDTFKEAWNESILERELDDEDFDEVMKLMKFRIYDTLYFKDGKYYEIEYESRYEGCYIFNLSDEVTEHEAKGSIEKMWEIFGGTFTQKGYKQLDSHIGLIYGDSITLERAEEICKRLEAKGFASTNVVLGIGSFTYQFVTRDTFGIAIKATYGEVNGAGRNIFKKPKTDDGTKNSAKGLLAVYYNDVGELYCFEEATWEQVRNCEFVKVFSDGKITKEYSLSEIRETLTDDNMRKIEEENNVI